MICEVCGIKKIAWTLTSSSKYPWNANAISGSVSLTSHTATLSAGIHTITATYTKDTSNNSNNDCGTLILPEIVF